jgi:hypothetical protein
MVRTSVLIARRALSSAIRLRGLLPLSALARIGNRAYFEVTIACVRMAAVSCTHQSPGDEGPATTQEYSRRRGPDFNATHAFGYRGFLGFEKKANSSFAPLMCAAQHRDADLHTSITVAFARTPMVTALESCAVNEYCQGIPLFSRLSS